MSTFQPDSLHPYIMDERLKKATGSGGIGNIPIASADTVGGIMIGGSANPITITGSGNASVRKATAELLGVIKAGDGVSIDADGAISGVAYSTTEHKTGRKWVDGKDIYERTIALNLTSISDRSFSVNVDYSNIDSLLDSFIEYKTSMTYGMLITSAWINPTAETFNIKTNTTADDITELYLTIKYTKTTP